MANKVNPSPSISKPFSITDIRGVINYLITLARDVVTELGQHAVLINIAIVNDGSQYMTAPFGLREYLVAALPNATLWEGGLIYVSNETGGAVIAFSDGTNWRRVTDRVVVS